MMNKKLKDYLHLYLECEVETNIPGQYVHPYGCVKLEDLTPENLYRILDRIDIDERNKQTWDEDSDHYCKLILRPLSDMTDDEKLFLQLNLFQSNNLDNPNAVLWSFDQMKILLSKHFDLFGLIDAGLAIDSTKTPIP